MAILHESLQTALADNGFAREYRRFVPHITLGRSIEFDELVYAQLQETEFKTSFTASEITLFESVKEKASLFIILCTEKNFDLQQCSLKEGGRYENGRKNAPYP